MISRRVFLGLLLFVMCQSLSDHVRVTTFGRTSFICLIKPRTQDLLLTFTVQVSDGIAYIVGLGRSLPLDLTYTPRVKHDHVFNVNPYMLGNIIYKHRLQLLCAEQRAEIEELLRLVEEGAFKTLEQKISDKLVAINQSIEAGGHAVVRDKHRNEVQQRRKELTKLLELAKNGSYEFEELHGFLEKKLENLKLRRMLAMCIIEQLSPRELAEVFDKITHRQQAQQAEKIEKLQQVKVEEGAAVLRRTKLEALEDKGQDEIHILLALFVLWFLLCYCPEGTVEHTECLTIGLLSVLLIILLLSGDIEKNPGPLTGQELAKVDQGCLCEDDLNILYKAVSPLANHWAELCIYLGLKRRKREAIKSNHKDDLKECLYQCLAEWLQRDLIKGKYDQPSWRWLIDSISEINYAFAKKLAREHPVAVKMGSRLEAGSLRRYRFKRSSDFSFVFRKVSRCLKKDLLKTKKLKRFLDKFCDPDDEFSGCLYVRPEVYKAASSTRGILNALFPKYISATDIDLLQSIVEKFGCSRCEMILKNYAEKHLRT